MKLWPFLILFYYSVYSQSHSNSAKKPSTEDILRGTLQALKNSECAGLNNQFYAVLYNEKGLVFKKRKDASNSKNFTENIVLPLKNDLNFKVNSLPQIACDVSEGKFKGRIYICWSDLKNGLKNEDVFLVYSDDEGENWSEPILISYYPNHKKQFKPVLYVNTINGWVNILYYENKNSLQNNLSDLALAQSKNGGMLFEYFKLNKKSFLDNGQYVFVEPTLQEKRTELNISWFEKKKQDSENYLRINDSVLANISTKNNANLLKLEKTFLFSDTIKILFFLETDLKLSAAITRPLEPAFERILLKDKKMKSGNNVLLIKTKDLTMNKGSYILTLYYNQQTSYCWITED